MVAYLFMFLKCSCRTSSTIRCVARRQNASFYNHVIIVTEESAEVTYVENYLSNASGEGNQLNIISEVIAGANSNITYGSVDYMDKGFTGHIIRHWYYWKRMPQLIGH